MASVYAGGEVSPFSSSPALSAAPSPHAAAPPAAPKPPGVTVPLRTHPAETTHGYMFNDYSDVYHYTDCPDPGNAPQGGHSRRPPAGRRLAHCCIGWGLAQGFYAASDVLVLLTAELRGRGLGADGGAAGGTAVAGDAAVAAAASVADRCKRAVPHGVGLADGDDDDLYHTLAVCPLLARNRPLPVAAQVVPTDGRGVCVKCDGMAAVGARLAPSAGPVTPHVVLLPRPRPAYVAGWAYWVLYARSIHGHPRCTGLDTTTKEVLAAAVPPAGLRFCMVCGGPGSPKADRF